MGTWENWAFPFLVSQLFDCHINSFNSPQGEPSAGLVSQNLMKKEIWQHALEVIRVVGFFIFPPPYSLHPKPSARIKIPPGSHTISSFHRMSLVQNTSLFRLESSHVIQIPSSNLTEFDDLLKNAV